MSGAPKEFLLASEVADLAREWGYLGVPHNKRNVGKYIVENGLDRAGPDLRRKRMGRVGGGGWEYHFSLFPSDFGAKFKGSSEERALTAQHDVAKADEARKLVALQTSALSQRARSVMEARAQVLTSIEGYAIALQQTRAWGIRQFLAAQDAYGALRAIEAKRERGEALDTFEAAALAQPCLLRSRDGFDVSPECLELACDRRKSGKVGRATLYNWFKARGDRGTAALSPIPPKTAGSLPENFAAFLKFYAIPSKPSASDALGEFLKENPTSDLTLHQVRYVLRERMNNIEKNVGREGLLTLRSRLPYVTRTTEDMWPTTIYTADGKTFDAEVADPVSHHPIRPEITTILDVVTRKVVGIALSRSENVIAVTEALRNSCVAHGIPAIFYVDRGPGYKNKTFDADVGGMMGRLSITKMHALAYGSQAKGRIERPNATIWDVLAKRLPTYIGKDMDKEAGKLVHKITRSEIKQFGQSKALPTWDEFVKLCEDRVAEYNAQPHRGLPKFRDEETGRMRHMSPNEAWAAHVASGFEPVDVSEDEVDDLFRPYEMRTCARGEVKWRTNSYFDPALERYHGEKVMVGYDYQQADKVWVREFDVESGQPGPLICVAGFMANAERYVPRSYEQEAVEKRATGRLKRADNKRRSIEAERDGVRFLESRHEPIVDLFPQDAPERDAVPIQPAAQPRVAQFLSDEDLAAWALENPEQLTADQIGVLKDCMSRSTARELFRMSGIDTEALRTLLRAVA
ncbi:Mu transposase C-terminal domain-containing protein [Planktotalea sp.]|uniref:Mu transposase C-terminal domain-containing protein n=1 Tax=Planktotalea sp. TaxID=2029877 RepID=UPI003D6B2B00